MGAFFFCFQRQLPVQLDLLRVELLPCSQGLWQKQKLCTSVMKGCALPELRLVVETHISRSCWAPKIQTRTQTDVPAHIATSRIILFLLLRKAKNKYITKNCS